MPDLLFSVAVAAGFLAMATSIVLGAYFLTRLTLNAGRDGDRTHDLSASVAARVVALHGLILALVYAQELDNYKGLQTVLTEEAIAVSDVYNDARRYGVAAGAPIQAELATYLDVVVGDEWRRLGQGEGLSGDAWRRWESVYEKLLGLTPTTGRERYLAGRMRERVAAIARFRQMREATATARFSGLFWAPALIGLAFVAAPFYVYRPSRSHIALLTIFSAYSGVILFFIYAFSNPFNAPGKLEPAAFQHLLNGDIGKSRP